MKDARAPTAAKIWSESLQNRSSIINAALACGVDALDEVQSAMARCDANWSLALRADPETIGFWCLDEKCRLTC